MHHYLDNEVSLKLDQSRTTRHNVPAIFSLETFFLLPNHMHVHRGNSNL